MAKKKRDNDPGGTHRIKPKGYSTKSKAMKTIPRKKEESGKELLDRIMHEIWSNIRKKEGK